MPNWILITIFSILMLPGFLGIFLPFPSAAFMFAIALTYGFVDKFSHLSIAELSILGILAALSLLIDYSAGLIGAKYGGASKTSILLGLIGFLLGTIILPPFGGIAGVFVGVFLGEFINKKPQKQALKAAGTSLLGTVSGMIANLFICLLFLILFILFAK